MGVIHHPLVDALRRKTLKKIAALRVASQSRFVAVAGSLESAFATGGQWDNDIVAIANPWHLPNSEFDAVMAEIDAELRRENDRVIGREIRGWLKFCERFKISVALDDPLACRVTAWFETMYGVRLNLDSDFGKSFVIVRGDPYRIRCFRTHGVVYVICSATILGREIRQRTPDGEERPVVNLLDGDIIEGLTPELARCLSPADCAANLTRYSRAFSAFTVMEGALAGRCGGEDAPYMKEAMDDLLEASECILRRTPNYGQSAWASLQASEKCLKSYIREKGGSHGKTHDIQLLSECAAELGLPTVDQESIATIQCRPDVRYDASLVSRERALAAYDTALMVCALTSKHIIRTTAQASIGQVRIRIEGNEPTDGLILAYHPFAPPFFTRLAV